MPDWSSFHLLHQQPLFLQPCIALLVELVQELRVEWVFVRELLLFGLLLGSLFLFLFLFLGFHILVDEL